MVSDQGGMDAVTRGRQAEDLACEHLQSLGYRVVARNYRSRRGEVDIIVRDGSTLVFVEVRCRTNSPASASIDQRKMMRIAHAARRFLLRYPNLYCRFDVVTVDGDPLDPACEVTHLPGAFDLSDISAR